MIQNRRIIGLTGGIGTGKSTVSSYLISKGYDIVDFDKISRKIYIKSSRAYFEVLEEYGKSILSEDGDIDRKKLGSIVFSDEEKLKKLNEITHNAIYGEAKEEMEKILVEKDIVFLDIPLLFESREYLKKYDMVPMETWLVHTNRETQIERVVKRDSMDRAEAEKRVDSQMAMEEKEKLSDKIIDNSGSKEETYRIVDGLLRDIGEQQ